MTHDLQASIWQKLDLLLSNVEARSPSNSEDSRITVRNRDGLPSLVAVRWMAFAPHANNYSVESRINVRFGNPTRIGVLVFPVADKLSTLLPDGGGCGDTAVSAGGVGFLSAGLKTPI